MAEVEAEEVQLMQHLLTLFLRMMQNLMKQQIREFWGLLMIYTWGAFLVVGHQ